jgi:hypothetical protein
MHMSTLSSCILAKKSGSLIFSGNKMCWTCRFMAHTWTALGLIFRPVPAGAGGCVTTATISYGHTGALLLVSLFVPVPVVDRSNSIRRHSAAKDGVPMNTSRFGSLAAEDASPRSALTLTVALVERPSRPRRRSGFLRGISVRDTDTLSIVVVVVVVDQEMRR